MTDRRKIRDLNRHRGIPNRLDPTAARAHLALLRETMSWAHIAAATGCSAAHLRLIAGGTATRINQLTHQKITSVRPTPARDGGLYVNATGSIRRVRALMTRGHSQYAIADAAGTTQYRVSLLASGQPRMRQKLADKIATAYQQLAHHDGTSKRARTIATANGWRAPDYWEDVDRIDDPDFNPDARDSRTQALAEDALWLEEQGYSRQHAAERLGVHRDYLHTAIRRWRDAIGEAA